MSELKPCPHCGEANELYPSYRLDKDGKYIEPPYAIDCLGCGTDFTPRDRKDAREAWNRRATASQEQAGWRDMSNAPKDGAILIDIGETIPDLVDARVGQFISEARGRELDEPLSSAGGWIIWTTDADWFVIPCSDAHGWMPLPAAPGLAAPVSPPVSVGEDAP